MADITRTMVAWAVVTAALSYGGEGLAQERRAGGGDQALKRAQYMLRMLNRERDELESRVAELERERERLAREIDALEARNDELGDRLRQSGEVKEQLMERIHADARKYRQLLARYRGTVKGLKLANADNRFLVGAVEEREAWIEKCRERNDGLFAANQDLMERYKAAGFAATGTLLGLQRVEIENEVQEYRFRIEDLRVTEYEPSGDFQPRVREPGQGLPEDGANPAGAGAIN